MTSTSATTGSTGTVVTTGSTTYISSSASNLDTSSLIATAMATRTASADTIDAEVTTNKSKISAYSEVQTLVNALSTSVETLASATNLGYGETSAFGTNEATVTSSDSSTSASSVLTATASSTAADGTYSLTVAQLATTMKVAGSTMSGSTALGYTGSFSLAAADGTAATISVTSTMTLSDVAAAINNDTSTTGVSATLIQVSSGDYKMVLSSSDTGEAITATAGSGDDVLNEIGITTSTGAFASTIQSAQNAIITLDGVTATYTSNTLTDVIPGVTLDLDATTTSSNPITLSISQDTSGVTTAVNNFITAYNALHDYLATQETVGSDGTVASSAYLFADSTVRSLNSTLNSLITGSVTSSGDSSSAISYLSQLGITLDSNNDLELSDSTALSDALASNSSAVQSFFQSSYSSSNSSLLLMSNDNLNTMSFTLDITANATGVTGATVNGQSGLFTVSGDELIGASGTAYAGLTFAITATADTSVDISLKQGFADSLVSLGTQYGNTSTGMLEQQISSVTDTDTTLSAESASIRSSASTYETTLITKYATMETEISSAQIVQAEIEAVLNGSTSSSS